MITRVGEDDWELWRDVRLEALRLHPEAFGSSLEEEQDRPEEAWRQRLRQVTALAHRGLRSPGGIAGIDGIAVLAEGAVAKTRHRGDLFSMYVRAEARGKGVGDALVAAILAAAGTKGLLQVHCSVVAGNDRARRLYERHGFRIYGTEPRALQVAGRFLDEHLMVCRLDATADTTPEAS